MTDTPYGRILTGEEDEIRRSYEHWATLPIDQEMMDRGEEEYDSGETTLAKPVSVTGPGTFLGHAESTLTFEPITQSGWWLDRADLHDSLPIHVSVHNVWTVVRNIVLHCGSVHNYVRMVEHFIALKLGLGLDNCIIRMDSGDPPLFDRSSMDLVEAVEEAGIVSYDRPAKYVTVKEPVTVAGSRGDFLTFLPAENGSRDLVVDCGIDFSSAIGKQRIKFLMSKESFRHGALARTNTTLAMMLYCKSIGKVFADVRHLGYTTKNILIAGPKKYVNEPYLLHEGKSLEAAWHRATLDLLAAVALIERGRFAGTVISYKAGHALDVTMIKELYRHELLRDLPPNSEDPHT